MRLITTVEKYDTLLAILAECGLHKIPHMCVWEGTVEAAALARQRIEALGHWTFAEVGVGTTDETMWLENCIKDFPLHVRFDSPNEWYAGATIAVF